MYWKNWKKVDFAIFDPKKSRCLVGLGQISGKPVKIVKKWLYQLILGMFMDNVKNFCDHSMILWEMAANRKPIGSFWTPPASFRVNKQTKWMKYQVIGNQIKEEEFEICIKSVYRYERRKEKTREITSFLSILSDFQQIQGKFCQLFAKIMRWSLENFRKSYQNYRSFDEKGRKKLFCKGIAKKSQKGPKMSRKFFFFSKFQKRSKKVEKMILSPLEVVSEWGNREKVVKKRKMKKKFRDFNSPDGNEIVANLRIRQRFLPPALFWKVGELKASSDLQIWHYFTSVVPFGPSWIRLNGACGICPAYRAISNSPI